MNTIKSTVALLAIASVASANTVSYNYTDAATTATVVAGTDIAIDACQPVVSIDGSNTVFSVQLSATDDKYNINAYSDECKTLITDATAEVVCDGTTVNPLAVTVTEDNTTNLNIVCAVQPDTPAPTNSTEPSPTPSNSTEPSPSPSNSSEPTPSPSESSEGSSASTVLVSAFLVAASVIASLI